MKKYIFLAASALTLASCTSDDFLGDTPGNVESNNVAISFGGSTGKISRATETQSGATAAATLGNNFIVYGTKSVADKTSIVYNHYNVNYNTDWKYEGITTSSLNTPGSEQTLKYWDYSASNYNFVAFSLAGKTIGNGNDQIEVAKIADQTYPTYTLKGKVSDLKGCFIADPVTVSSDKFGEKVKFTFRSTGTKVSVGIYETIPGYSIKDIKFYKADDTKITQPVLYASTPCIPSTDETGTLKVIFDKTPATTVLTEDETGSTDKKTKDLEFSEFSLGTDKEKNETSLETDKYLGRDRSTATKTGELSVMPSNIADGLTLKIDYTLISTDGSGEEINVTGATVKVPNSYTNWQSNYHYTYIFKITPDTNGSTGGSGGIAGLKPIVFDAIITEDFEGSQTTETEIKDNGKTDDITNERN